MGDVFEQALRVEMDRNYLSMIELGRSGPSVRMLIRLCMALNVHAADVLGAWSCG
jgi:transcriptional regulator with XRE-family HTH domain